MGAPEGEARKQVTGGPSARKPRSPSEWRGQIRCSGERGRARELQSPGMLSLLPWGLHTCFLDYLCTEHSFQGNYFVGSSELSQVGGHPIEGTIGQLRTLTDIRTALCAVDVFRQNLFQEVSSSQDSSDLIQNLHNTEGCNFCQTDPQPTPAPGALLYQTSTQDKLLIIDLCFYFHLSKPSRLVTLPLFSVEGKAKGLVREQYHNSYSAMSQFGKVPLLFRACAPLLYARANDFQASSSPLSDISLNAPCDSDHCNITHRSEEFLYRFCPENYMAALISSYK